ncbi:MAG: hypothetical protein QM607_00365 [Microbacterium sp.]
MVTLKVDPTMLEIVLSSTERRLGRLPGTIGIERAAIARVQLTDEPWTWIRGGRSHGTHVRGAIAIGTWGTATGDDLVIVRGRKLPGVVIDLTGDPSYARIVLSTKNGEALARALN